MSRILLAGAVSSVIGICLLFPGSASAADSWSYQAALNPVTANQVSGNGASWISVTGNTAEIQIQVNGLLDGAPHAQTIRIDAQGSCPAQAEPSGPISGTDGQPLHGAVGAALTTDGDSSPAAALALSQFPAAGSYTYSRTIDLDQQVVAALRNGTAVLLVQGVDLNGTGSYDAVPGASELDPTLPAEATDPALCGTFEPMQMAGVPAGPAAHIAALYREIAQAITEGRPAHPGFDTAVHHHQTLAAIERAAQTGVRQPLAPPAGPRQTPAARDHTGRTVT